MDTVLTPSEAYLPTALAAETATLSSMELASHFPAPPFANAVESTQHCAQHVSTQEETYRPVAANVIVTLLSDPMDHVFWLPHVLKHVSAMEHYQGSAMLATILLRQSTLCAGTVLMAMWFPLQMGSAFQLVHVPICAGVWARSQMSALSARTPTGTYQLSVKAATADGSGSTTKILVKITLAIYRSPQITTASSAQTTVSAILRLLADNAVTLSETPHTTVLAVLPTTDWSMENASHTVSQGVSAIRLAFAASTRRLESRVSVSAKRD